MATNSRFQVATHLLVELTLSAPKPLSSARLARRMGTHPVVIRRMMGLLIEGGLVRSISGRSGGFTLARPPERIHLGHIFGAVDDGAVLGVSAAAPHPDHPVARYLEGILARPTGLAVLRLVESLSGTSLEDLAEDIRHREAANSDKM